MRAKLLLVGGLTLLLASCSGGGGQAPPPLKKELLTGKWKSNVPDKFITGYEFTEDGHAKMTVARMEQAVPTRYSWTGDRTLEVEYGAPADMKEAYTKAAKAYKDDVEERVKTKKLSDKAGPSILEAVEEELPGKHKFQVALIEGTPRQLYLTNEKGVREIFDKVE